MRTLIVTHFYPPEVGAPQTRLSSLAHAWAAAGDQVTVLTGFPNYPTGIIPQAYRRKLFMSEQTGGVRVVRAWLYATPNEGVLRRTLGHLSFMVTSVLLGMPLVGKQDVVVVSSPTFFSIFSGWLLARLRRARFVIDIRDLWPSFAVELGMVRGSWTIRLLRFLERTAYRAADAVVAVTRGMRDQIIALGTDESKLHVITNGVDVHKFSSGSTNRDKTRQRLGASAGDLLAVYIGAHGTSYALGDVIDVAVALRDEPVHFALVGDGPTKQDLERRVGELSLDNVTLCPSVPHDEMPRVLEAADVCLIPDRDLQFLSVVIRAKTFEYMAAGKPIVGAVHGATAEILTEAGQLVVPPHDRDAIMRSLRDLMTDPERRQRIGAAGRAYVAERFDWMVLARAFRGLLSSVIDEGKM